MVWTHPMTFTADSVLTAAQLNTHLRDNLLETEVGRAQTSGDLFVVEGINRIGRRRIGADRVSTAEATSSTEYTDLATIGPSVTVTTSSRALVFISAKMTNAAANNRCRMSYEITGATERGALDNTCLLTDGRSPTDQGGRMMNFDMIGSALTPGVNTFSAKYRVSSDANAGTFDDRVLVVLPL